MKQQSLSGLTDVIAVAPNEFVEESGSGHVKFAIGLFGIDELDPRMNLMSWRYSHLASWRYRVLKRGIDCVCASLLLGVLAIPCLLIAAAIYLDTDDSVFYRERRVGRDGLSFQIWKFRSMRQSNVGALIVSSNATEDATLHRRLNKDANDNRITTTGRFLRRWSLDELPQLINVVRGEMSLVGPRPVIQEELRYYGELQDSYLAAVPGMSGLWQVSGRSNLSFATRVQLDHSYIQSWSLRRDLEILAQTLPAVLRRVGAR